MSRNYKIHNPNGTANIQLSYALTPQGMIDTAGGGNNYHYYLTDQLGSVRVIFCDLDGNGRVDIHGATSEACLASGKMLQVNNFYPYGMQHVDWDISDDNPYMFQPKRSGDPGLVPGGKEMKEHTLSGALLAWYDFGARQYDPVLGRWHARDPLAAKFAGMSPYCGMGNNPIVYIDPDGESILGLCIIAGIGAIVGAYIGGASAEGGKYKPTKWDWDKETWKGIGAGTIIGAGAGIGAYFAAPVLAGVIPGSFGASGTTAAYVTTGFVAGGVAGYGAGLSGALLGGYSMNNAHQIGVNGFKIGASIGSAVGAIFGLVSGIEEAKKIKKADKEEASEDGWIKVPGGYMSVEGEEQSYYVTKSGRLIPSWRAENLSHSSFNRSFRIPVNPNEIGPYLTTNQIDFPEKVNNITCRLGYPFILGNEFHMWSGDNMIVSSPNFTVTPQSGNSVSWQSWGYIHRLNYVFFFTLTITR